MITSHTVLVVDDDPRLAQGLARALIRPDRKVLVAMSPKEAIQVIGREPIDVVVSDDQMPEMSGRELLKRLRQSHPDIVRILMTGHPSLESALETINQEEAHRYLTKPFSSDDLDREIAQALQRSKERVQHRQAIAMQSRRAQLLAALEHEHPGLTKIPAQPYDLAIDPVGEELLLRASEEVPSAPLALPTRMDVVALAEQLLLLPMLRPRVTITIEQAGGYGRLVVHNGTRQYEIAALDIELGDALAARVALLGGLDLAGVGHQIGRVRVGADNGGELLIALRTSSLGLSVEVRRMLQAKPVGPAPSEEEGSFGSYRLGEVLGEGGLGIVYRAENVHLQRTVAIKIMKVSANADPIAAARLLREARAASRSRSDGVVDVLDFGRLPDQRPFIVMELVEAPTLEQRIEAGALPIEQAVTIARNIAVALGAAHDTGVVHRDLKPSNIFVDDQLRIKISDFGAAKLMHDVGPALTQEGMTIGTPQYMPPEQARGEQVDRRSDIYALGCVLFEMLTGRPPFEGDNALAVVTKHVLSAPPLVTSPHGPLPLALSRTVARALAKNRAERHQNTAEFIGDLDQALVALRRTGWRKWLQ